MEVSLLKDIATILILAIIVVLVCYRFHIPPLIGLIVTGILSGPHGGKLVAGVEKVDTMAELGVILLLFTVGMEFPLRKLLKMKQVFFLGGGAQMLFTVLGGAVIAVFLSRPFGEAAFLGCLLAMSSTALVFKMLSDRLEINTPHGRIATTILIFQDVLVIPLMILVPVFAGVEKVRDPLFFLVLVKGCIILALVLVVAVKGLPMLFRFVTRTQSRELFLLTVLAVCLCVAWVAASAGLSLSLGAFLAGLVLSDTEYRHQAIGDIQPLQDIFVSIFFISIGMLVDVTFVLGNLVAIVAIALGVIVLKFSCAAAATALLAMPIRTTVLVGCALAQVGEFSFILAREGIKYGLASEFYFQLFLSASLVTMGLSPYLFGHAQGLADLFSRVPAFERFKTGLARRYQGEAPVALRNHVIIVGFGKTGRYIANACRAAGINYVVLELNNDIVLTEKSHGHPIFFGDSSHASVLHFANIGTAKAVAVAINDTNASRRIIKAIRAENRDVYIVARTHYLRERTELYRVGVNEAIADEFESSLQIFSHVLQRCQVSKEDIDRFIKTVSADGRLPP